jgi:tRNA(Ile)-lysidine synthetase-like protein
VVHVDHQLRESSHQDAQFVSDLCASYQRNCHIVRIKVPPKGNRQAHARSQRYAALGRVAHEYRTRVVATGHHAHDQRENTQLRHVMGRFGDLVEFRELPQWDICLWRPLLSLDRPRIQTYADTHGLAWREDESNASDRYLRNRVRDLSQPVNEEPIAYEAGVLPRRVAAHRWWVASEDVRDLAEACRFIPGITLSRGALNALETATEAQNISTHGGLICRTAGGFEVIRTTGQGTRMMPARALSRSEDVRKLVKMEF